MEGGSGPTWISAVADALMWVGWWCLVGGKLKRVMGGVAAAVA